MNVTFRQKLLSEKVDPNKKKKIIYYLYTHIDKITIKPIYRPIQSKSKTN